MEHGLRGPNVTFNQREASSLAALSFAASAIRSERVAAMLSGGADWVDEVFFRAHDRFHALAPKRAGGAGVARPFDRRRNGFTLGEGGFLLLVESAASAAARGVRVHGELLGLGAASCAVAVNAWPNRAEPIARAMRVALEDAGVSAADVAAVWGTANGSLDLDAIEADAIGQVFGRMVPVVSIKGAIGEQGAAGAAAIVAGLVALGDRRLPPTAGWREADPACPVDVSCETRLVDGAVFVVNAAASGGAIYSAVIRAGA
jgi:3-oxoacyl-(acyl-carrier-protein) synthase